MKLIILESNKDKKGSILEGIVKTLLINMGFRDVVTNEVGSGGSEIDVVAKKTLLEMPNVMNLLFVNVRLIKIQLP